MVRINDVQKSEQSASQEDGLKNDSESNQIYFTATYTPLSWLVKNDSYFVIQNRYTCGAVDIGYQFPSSLSQSGLFAKTYPLLSGQVSYLLGDISTLNSTRLAAGIKAGVRTYIGDWLSLAPAIGLAYANNKLNYGAGYLPLPKPSLVASTNLDVFVTPWNFPIAAVTSLRYENSFVGEDKYQSYILAFGLGLALTKTPD